MWIQATIRGTVDSVTIRALADLTASTGSATMHEVTIRTAYIYVYRQEAVCIRRRTYSTISLGVASFVKKISIYNFPCNKGTTY